MGCLCLLDGQGQGVGDHELGDPVAAAYGKAVSRLVDKANLDLASVVAVDNADAVGERDAAFYTE